MLLLSFLIYCIMVADSYIKSEWLLSNYHEALSEVFACLRIYSSTEETVIVMYTSEVQSYMNSRSMPLHTRLILFQTYHTLKTRVYVETCVYRRRSRAK